MAIRKSELRKFPLLSRFALFAVLPLVLLSIAGYSYFTLSLPEQHGTFHAPGLRAPVHIGRDAQGVPHISASNAQDVFFATGYVHAQDRLWQLEIQRRFAQGRLSEVFGRASVEQDIWLRTLGLYAAGQASWPGLGADAKASLQAYTDGINAWLASHPRLPPEFAALGVVPEKWTVFDSLAWVKVFALNLSGNSDSEMAHFFAAQSLSEQEMRSLFGHRIDAARAGAALAGQSAAASDSLMRLGRLQRALQQQLGIGGKYVGSNAWAVSGKLTGQQGAMLANDPHLGLQMPSLWYPVVQQGGALASSGMSLVGLPLVIFGRNEHISWGGTSMTADVQDLYFEEVNPQDAHFYRVDNAWERFTTRTETIAVRAEFPAALREQPKPVQLLVRGTRHGPVVSDANGAGGQPVALRWTALDGADTTYESFLRLNYAHDWATFKAALQLHVAPALNMLYADGEGNIGFLGVGKVPIRAQGDGSLPSPGWDGQHEWRGFIPFSAMPQSYNPESGYLVSANDKNVGPDYPYFISNDWAPPGRAQRIAQLIEQHKRAGGRLTADDFGRMQLDLVSLPAASMLTLLGRMHPVSARQRQALATMRGWQGDMGLDSPAAAIFNVWMTHLKQRLFAARLRPDWAQRGQADYLDSVLAGVTLDALHAVLTSDDELWCTHGAGPASCEAKLQRSLDDALDELSKLAGNDMQDWAWGKLHRAVYRHAPFSQVNFLKEIFEKRVDSGGSADTINVANQVFVKSEGYNQTFGSSFRQIIALHGAESTQLYMNSTGQSGNIFSSHYSDTVLPFREGKYMRMERASIAAAGSGITLVPAVAAITPVVRQ